ncbi:sugar-binding transcriptional regulator [Alicyclobacillus pomorum]|uniref:sugar-binding transcriptional regulator n=1 Tax=Alicyclobacillus pomorum TaxID=204470 RepID=UPI0003FE9816|nr:sugar-binding domain-containing protein [Alicyclobacillus pomorum]
MDAIDLSVARRIVPELIETLQERAWMLHRIRLLQPIGRRALAVELATTERVLRAEVEFLRQQGLIVSAPAGMSLTEEGNALLDELDKVLATIEGRAELSARLSRVLGIQTVYIVSGNSDQEAWVKDTLGYQAGVQLRELLREDDVLAVTGGTTMAAVARMMPKKGSELPLKVVPARGGLGESVYAQANTIAEELADKLGGTSVMLHVPDRLSTETLEILMQEPQVQQRLQEVRNATVVVHGIGDAVQMAKRRQLSAEEIQLLRENDAVAEAFGYYFNRAGQIVYAMTTVGLRLDDLADMRLVIGVAGGSSKAAAIAAAAKAYKIDVLVTDEGAAREILNLHGGIHSEDENRH